ncbi:hypothetical protein PNK_1248 [Candidatus Protochlamydia naegleriophila]|uniref:CAAX prenyl protease 2/Lysostaphin resistance protein A-like domain-containing protein n=1 Tax=Candidatus Protochlamydia naegleriophila TaxID=389348 RepID=A0A0U5ERW5_9BACT|nr:CPBP family intramembrane glutamic endopeptidase [Candidatus Protochlamydia naegleriophila]CUI16865.1 hypothetical protein PNK_1248 [Candidatus Protochlamydia naegleriophila]
MSPLSESLSNVASVVGGGVIGGLGAQIGSFLARPVTVLTSLLDRALPRDAVQWPLYNAAKVVGGISNILHGPLVNRGIFTEKQYSNFVAPITEEIVFRAIIQEGSSYLLQSAGVPSTLSKVISIAATTFLFAEAHNPIIESEQFASVGLQGTAFGITQAVAGTPAAIVAHGVSNIITNSRN